MQLRSRLAACCRSHARHLALVGGALILVANAADGKAPKAKTASGTPRFCIRGVRFDTTDGTGQKADLRKGDTATGFILGIEGAQNSFAHGNVGSRGEANRNYVVATGVNSLFFYRQGNGLEVPLLIGGELLLTDSLAYAGGKWKGVRRNTVHVLHDTLVLFGHDFRSSPTDPLQFQATDSGYLYLSGKGRVVDLKLKKEIFVAK